MQDDEAMDQLLKTAFAAEAPRLSPAFDARVLRRVRPRHLAPLGRLVIAIYVVIAAAGAVWLMRDLPLESIALAATIGLPVAAGVGAYGRRLAVDG
ncbi:MAG TPA: hypothetical protein VN851_05045 [Thermoanaerobaculia bacterium]|nr:hypothetical protein [Thermoanaerobaculia bacterium]